jgi:hypothetical protein
MIFGDDLLDFVVHSLVVPVLLGEEPLDGSDGLTGLEGDGLAIFSREVGKESGEINSEVVSGILVWGTGFEASEQSFQIGSNFREIGRVHFGVLRVGKLHNGSILQHFCHSGQYQFIAL